MPDISRVAMLAGLDEGRAQVWSKAGLFDRVDATTADWVARAHLLAQLERAGVALEVLKAADREDVLARAYIFEFLQVARQGQHLLRNVCEQTGMDEQLLLRICDALGFDDPSVFSDAELELITGLFEAMREGIPESMTLELCELWGTQMRFIAHAEAISYDTNLARRVWAEAASPLEGAAKLAPLTRAMLRTADLFPQPLHRRHLLQAISLEPDSMLASQPPAELLPPGEVDVAVGFVDLTGYTTLTEKEGDRQALAYARRLERIVRRAAQEHNSRIVKRLGDGFMLASPAAGDLLHALVDIVTEAAERENMPTARGAAAYGRAVSRAGDYFGHTVNLAARVLDQARPSEVLATEDAVDQAERGPFGFHEPRDLSLKGVQGSVRVWRVEPISPRRPASPP